MSWIAPAVTGAVGLYSSLRNGQQSFDSVRRFADTLRPEGYISAADTGAAERARSRLTGSARNNARGERMSVFRRARQRGISTAPALEATLSRVADTEAQGVQHAGDVANEIEYNAYAGNKGFEQQKDLALLGGKIQDRVSQNYRADLQKSATLNSILELTPSLIDNLHKLSPDVPTDAATGVAAAGEGMIYGDDPRSAALRYNPATGQFEPFGGSTDPRLERM